MTIYTKEGDRGKTRLFTGKKISKSAKIIKAIGAIDELNSYLAIVGRLVDIQKNLFTINSILAGAKLNLSPKETDKLEKEIDKLETKLSKQTGFIIYGGSKKACNLFYARALCRKAERCLVDLENKKINLKILPYLNRLSDYLFISARDENQKLKKEEIVWTI